MYDLLRYWDFPDNTPKNYGVIIALSYAVENTNKPNRLTRAVLRQTYKLWKLFPKAKVIVSTGDNQGLGKTNAKIMKEYAESLGIYAHNIFLEEESNNTYENLLFSRRIVEKNKLKDTVIVAHDLHMRRVLATAKKMGWNDIFWVSAYSEGGRSYGIKRFQTYSRFTVLIYEIFATLYSKLIGWI